MYRFSPKSYPVAKEAKIVKLKRNTFYKNDSAFIDCSPSSDSEFDDISFLSFSQVENSSETHSTIINNSMNSSTSFKSSSDSENDVTGEFLEKLYIIKDYTSQLVYGGISVKRAELVYLVRESDFYYLIENQQGIQGIVPKDICVDIEKTVQNAKQNLRNKTKTTSL